MLTYHLIHRGMTSKFLIIILSQYHSALCKHWKQLQILKDSRSIHKNPISSLTNLSTMSCQSSVLLAQFCHKMEAFSALLALCEGNPYPPVPICSPYPHLARHNVPGWPLIHVRKVSRTSCLVLSGPLLETNVRLLHSNMAIDCLTMEPSLDSSFGNWMPRRCNKLLCDLGQWAKSDAVNKVSKIALITGCGLPWSTTTWQSLSPTNFPKHVLIRRMVEIEQSNLSAIYWALRPGSVISTAMFLCRLDNIVCVYDISYWNTTMCLNKEEPLFYSLITISYVTVPVHRSGSRLHAWSIVCVPPCWFRGSFRQGRVKTTISQKNMCSIPMDMTAVLGLHKFSLHVTIDHHGPSMYSGHYTNSINWC